MALDSVSILVNVKDSDKAGVLASVFSTNPGSIDRLFRGDTAFVEVFFVEPSNDQSFGFWKPIVPTPGHFMLGAGDPDATSESGTWIATYDDTDSESLDFDESAATLQTAVNAVLTTESAGSVAVEELIPGTYEFHWNENGARDLFVGNASGLKPESNILVSRSQVGDGSTREKQIVQLIQRPFIFVNTTDWALTDALAATVDELRPGTVSDKAMFELSFNVIPFAGSFVVDDSSSISYNAEKEEFETAFPGFTVLKTGPATWTLEKNEVGIYALTQGDIDVTKLVYLRGIRGLLNRNTASLFKRFAATSGSSFETTLEIKSIDGSGLVEVVLQIATSIFKEVLSIGSIGPSSLPSYLTKEQSDRRYTENLEGITALVGGTSSDLDGQEHTAEDAGRFFGVDLGGTDGYRIWKFRAGDEATDEEDGIVRHADWTASTFEFVYERRL